MSAAHTPGRVTFKADGFTNHYSMLTKDGKWWLAVLHNGEQTSERQIANFRRLAACWNACEGVTTAELENMRFSLPEAYDRIRMENDALKARIDTLNAKVASLTRAPS